MFSLADTVSPFHCAPGDWLTFCSINPFDFWVREPRRTLEPGEKEKSEELCSHLLFASGQWFNSSYISTNTQLLLGSPSPMAPAVLGFITLLPPLVLPGCEAVGRSSQLGCKTVPLPIGSLNPAHASMNKLFIKQPLLTPLSLFSAETDCYSTCRYHMVRKTGEYFGGKHLYLMFWELQWIQSKT